MFMSVCTMRTLREKSERKKENPQLVATSTMYHDDQVDQIRGQNIHHGGRLGDAWVRDPTGQKHG